MKLYNDGKPISLTEYETLRQNNELDENTLYYVDDSISLDKDLKKKCHYVKGRSCNNCRHFGNISGHGYSYQFCKDERNEIPHDKNDWITGMSVEPDGLCDYWELTDGRIF